MWKCENYRVFHMKIKLILFSEKYKYKFFTKMSKSFFEKIIFEISYRVMTLIIRSSLNFQIPCYKQIFQVGWYTFNGSKNKSSEFYRLFSPKKNSEANITAFNHQKCNETDWSSKIWKTTNLFNLLIFVTHSWNQPWNFQVNHKLLFWQFKYLWYKCSSWSLTQTPCYEQPRHYNFSTTSL